MRKPDRLLDLSPDVARFELEVLQGLLAKPKTLPCKYFYDETGSRLFEEICELEEYYLTRADLEIMLEHAAEMASAMPPRFALIEFGSGTSRKTRILLDHAPGVVVYVPVDISMDTLRRSAEALSREHPRLEVMPVCADYTGKLVMPSRLDPELRRVVYFPGSTIGNFTPAEAKEFLVRIRGLVGPGGGLLIGVDLEKDSLTIHAAYNDRKGVTAAFNRNLLVRINRELGADFKVDRFEHRAIYNREEGRIEMYLISQDAQEVHLGGHAIHFAKGESVCTEYSYKYSLDRFARTGAAAGFKVQRVWTDRSGLFSVQYLTVTP